MELNKKKLMGILYPITIFTFIAFIYFALVVCPFFINHKKMFAPVFNLTYSIIILVFIHVLFLIIVYCYISCIMKNPGAPPKFWVNSIGFLH